MERKELLMTLMIGVLLLTTAMQTVALVGMSNGAIAAPVKSVASSPTTSAAPSTSGGSSGSLANLPSMVGGC